jgi:cysteine desulfurase
LLYFDHNATTPVAPEVLEAYTAALRDVPGNASSVHRIGQIARQRLESARQFIARRLGASAGELVFTSGGTESNNLGILGLVRSFGQPAKHVVTAVTEHPSVLEPIRQLEREGVGVTWVPVGHDGMVEAKQVAAAICPDTVLVSVMHANNETGVIQPISEIAHIVAGRRAGGQSIFFHCDGVQFFGKLPVDVGDLGVDIYSVSAHKVHGPKGIGALFVRKNTPLVTLLHGGGQERARRPGTEDVPGAVAFARAVELDAAQSPALRDRFEQGVLPALDNVEINGATSQRLPNTSNLLFHGLSGEALLIALDQQGMAVSTGSACSSGSVEPSHVILAMGRTTSEARASVRFSFGRANTVEDIDALTSAVISSVTRMRTGQTRKAQLVPA